MVIKIRKIINKGDFFMMILAKDINNIPFIVKTDKVDDFLNKKKNETKWNKILERAEKLEKNNIN